MDDSAGFWIFLLVIVCLIFAFMWGTIVGADWAAQTHCITLGFDNGEWVDGEMICETFKTITGG